MNFVKITIFFLLIAVSSWATEVLVFKTKVKAEQITNSTELGSLQVEDLGTIRLTAQKDGNRIIVQAAQTDGTVVGKAETVVGLDETPLYVITPKGLRQLIIRWRGDE